MELQKEKREPCPLVQSTLCTLIEQRGRPGKPSCQLPVDQDFPSPPQPRYLSQGYLSPAANCPGLQKTLFGVHAQVSFYYDLVDCCCFLGIRYIYHFMVTPGLGKSHMSRPPHNLVGRWDAPKGPTYLDGPRCAGTCNIPYRQLPVGTIHVIVLLCLQPLWQTHSSSVRTSTQSMSASSRLNTKAVIALDSTAQPSGDRYTCDSD